MKISAFALVCTLVLSPFAWGEEAVDIFNGKDLEGWKLPEDNIWWSVKEGAIICQSGPKKKGSIIWTEEEFADFSVELEFKFDGTGDSGVFLRSEMQQIQIGISGSLKRDMTGSMYIPKKGYPKEATGVKELLKIDEWNTMKIETKGSHYKVWLNGEEILDFDSGDAPEKGPVGLQLHAKKDMSAEFRKLKVAELKG